MSSSPTRQLPPSPNLTHLKKQAKDLHRGVRVGDPASVERVASAHPRADGDAPLDAASFTLRDAQVTLAREYGFDGWQELTTHVGEQMVDQRDMHRWFGVQLNNDMWKVIEDDRVGPATPLVDRERMLYSAYASAYHWRTIGNEANFARGEHLIARMAARLGEGEVALAHARRCLDLVETHTDVMEDWDAPFAYEALARAYAALGDHERARAHLDRATELTAAVADPEDRAILEAELAREPWFGAR